MAEKKKKIRVVIVDDQTLFREGIKDVLTGEKWLEVVGEGSDGEEAVALAKKLKPDVILMDIKLPKLDGISATRKIREDNPAINVLMLSSFEDEAHVIEAIQAGANGYLSKMLPASELLNSIKTFTSEGLMIPQQLMGKLLHGLRKMGDNGTPSQALLTRTEIKVISLLGKGLSNKELATELSCSVKTIKNHLNSAFHKLGVGSRTEAVVKAIEKGLISSEDSRIL
ncbi:Two-component transcriptional regulator, LuxR family [Elusimicrobium minutum Pei191]|uniref:Two-component transcriptional regulator, LuxR family n=1 Tax=Elusimicrobium minutum (strain Pei191) TaxID=445932 RepID=B2KE01_ELUMP|nr:response regulator transcription factor [Elusimicrobium minutum]ACC98747.1 Two-component transcriptional regulator, LuxR family [Elusimicrobium minutum Pei191]